MSVYDEYVVAKGYTVAECNRPTVITDEVAREQGYDSAEEYEQALHEFLNSN